jgi:hypothetical protein
MDFGDDDDDDDVLLGFITSGSLIEQLTEQQLL